MTNAIQAGSIVRVIGKCGDWRVLEGEGRVIGTHERQLCVEAVDESWIRRLTVPVSALYRSILSLKD